ncbi:MAG: hypothetical protein K8U03_12010 [Planctomycetia bacterium]|nr:hypothetical protein [Planctomycetia bacterium]
MPYSTAFHESVDLVLRVHELMRVGRGEDTKTNCLRADSEKPWYEMSDDEQELVGGLSEDLYTIDAAPNQVNTIPNQIEAEIKSASRDDDYPAVLAILRNNKANLPSAFLAHWRGLCWATLQNPNAGIPFFKEALRIDPDNGLHEYVFLQALLLTDRHEEGKSIALSIARNDKNPLLLYFAGMILFRCAFSHSGSKNVELLQASIKCVESANIFRDPIATTIAPKADVAANVWRSMAYDQLEMSNEAMAACEYSLRLDRTSEIANKLHDLLSRGKGGHSRDELLVLVRETLSSINSSAFSTAA